MKDLVSVILPAYNEAEAIGETVAKLRKKLLGLNSDFEIIIAENASTDGTEQISKKLSEEYKEVRYLHTKKGRGNALREAFSFSHGDILVYMDVDLSTDLNHLKEIIQAISEGNDIATGSRLLPQSRVIGRSTSREILSRAYNYLVRILLKSKIYDSQCGFKAFNRTVILELIDEIKDNHWFLDTEILVKAQRKGYNVKEIPVVWIDTKESKVSVVGDIIGMGSNIIRVWWEFRKR